MRSQLSLDLTVNLTSGNQRLSATREPFTSVDLFAGAGGLSLGLHAAGFQVKAAVEVDRDACETFRATFPHARLLDESIIGLDLKQYEGVDLVAGGPPCQPFSSGGKRLADKDVRNLVPEFVRVVRDLRPRAFLMENVFGLGSASRRPYLDFILAELKAIGYNVNWKVVNAADYGVPQKRRRLFVVGLIGGEYQFPSPTHGPGAVNRYVAVTDILNIAEVRGDPNPSKVIYAKNPDLRPRPFDGQLFNGGGRPIDSESPSHTILASAGGNKTHFVDTLGVVPEYHRHLLGGGKPRKGQVEGARRLTVCESALLQTFPPEMPFYGSRSSQYTQIGNAVPPKLAEVIAGSIACHLS